uniref:Uncharacterized protein n=1 Tax=Cacopsylla melanoneura TaxID=428564 RepID=A0A8D8XS23_9HEMI
MSRHLLNNTDQGHLLNRYRKTPLSQQMIKQQIQKNTTLTKNAKNSSKSDDENGLKHTILQSSLGQGPHQAEKNKKKNYEIILIPYICGSVLMNAELNFFSSALNRR